MNKEFLNRIISSLILLPFVIFIIIKGSVLFNLFLISCFSIATFEWLNMTKNKMNSFLGIIFLIFSFFSVHQMRFNYDQGFLFLVLIICILTDIGGFIFGKLIKGPKLTKISPKKTYSGMIGSFILPIMIIYLFLKNPYLKNLFTFNSEIFIFILFISLVSQIGDIIVSYFKRVSKIKDTGKIIPGHGGILDRIDGMIFAFPFSYLIFLFIGINFIK